MNRILTPGADGYITNDLFTGLRLTLHIPSLHRIMNFKQGCLTPVLALHKPTQRLHPGPEFQSSHSPVRWDIVKKLKEIGFKTSASYSAHVNTWTAYA